MSFGNGARVKLSPHPGGGPERYEVSRPGHAPIFLRKREYPLLWLFMCHGWVSEADIVESMFSGDVKQPMHQHAAVHSAISLMRIRLRAVGWDISHRGDGYMLVDCFETAAADHFSTTEDLTEFLLAA